MSDLDVKKAPALSRVPRGHWRNLWRRPVGLHVVPLDVARLYLVVDKFHYYGRGKFPSREIAEQKAIDSKRINPNGDVWLDATFFPEAG